MFDFNNVTLAPAPLYGDIDEFLEQYIQRALSSVNPKLHFQAIDLAMSAFSRMAEDCRRFQHFAEPFISQYYIPSPWHTPAAQRCAYDFWLVRNDHHARFPSVFWTEPAATELTMEARLYSPVKLYVGLYDHLIYQAGAEDR